MSNVITPSKSNTGTAFEARRIDKDTRKFFGITGPAYFYGRHFVAPYRDAFWNSLRFRVWVLREDVREDGHPRYDMDESGRQSYTNHADAVEGAKAAAAYAANTADRLAEFEAAKARFEVDGLQGIEDDSEELRELVWAYFRSVSRYQAALRAGRYLVQFDSGHWSTTEDLIERPAQLAKRHAAAEEADRVAMLDLQDADKSFSKLAKAFGFSGAVYLDKHQDSDAAHIYGD